MDSHAASKEGGGSESVCLGSRVYPPAAYQSRYTRFVHLPPAQECNQHPPADCCGPQCEAPTTHISEIQHYKARAHRESTLEPLQRMLVVLDRLRWSVPVSLLNSVEGKRVGQGGNDENDVCQRGRSPLSAQLLRRGSRSMPAFWRFCSGV